MTTYEIAKKLQSTYTLNQIEQLIIITYLQSQNIDLSTVKNNFIKPYLTNETLDIPQYLKHKEWTLKDIENLLELLIDSDVKKNQGVVFTPEYIVDYILQETCQNISIHSKIADLSCGCGAFLLRATEFLYYKMNIPIISIIENNIFGFDINENSIRQSKILLTLLVISNREDQYNINFNLHTTDTLKDDISQYTKNGFDYIVGNPPYVNTHDLTKNDIEYLKENYKTTQKGTFNIFYAFIERGLKLLSNNGRLGYIVPNNFLVISAAYPLRDFLQFNKNIEKIIDFDSNVIFNPVKTYNAIVILSNTDKQEFEFVKIPYTHNIEEKINSAEFISIQYDSLDSKSWHLLSKKEQQNIHNIERIGFQIGDFIKTGIATLSDKYYMIDKTIEDDIYYYKEYLGIKYPIEKSIVRKLTKISNCKTENEVKNHSLGIIFPYKIIATSVSIIDELEIQSIYPNTYMYFQAIRSELKKRDKGQSNLPVWYAYGRSQSLNLIGTRLLFPTFSKYPRFMKENENKALFCNGYALFLDDNIFVKYKDIIQKVLNSSIMKYYIDKTSYSIEGEFRCYQKKFVKNFSIPYFDDFEIKFLEETNNVEKINEFLIKKYNLKLS